MARVYATAADLAAYPGGADVPAESVDTLLRIASRVVDRLLVGRLYDVTVDGLPEDTDVAAALRDATCGIVLEAHAEGILTPGATGEWDSVSIGSVSLSGRSTSSTATTVHGIPVPPAALLALADVGVLTVWVGR